MEARGGPRRDDDVRRRGGALREPRGAAGGAAGWVPYAQVDDVDVAAKRAVALGAEVLQPKTRGPAGDFVVVRDPGGASLALWQKA